MKNQSPNFVRADCVKVFRTLFFVIIACFFASIETLAQSAANVASPNGRVKISFFLSETGAPRYAVALDGNPVLLESKLGLVRDDADFSKALKLVSVSKIQAVRDRYEILTTKRRLNDYRANRVIFHLQTAADRKMDIIFQVSDDGAVFRYFFPEKDSAQHRLAEEKSSFHFAPDTKAWLQPMAVARTGWKESQPSYEEYYEKEIHVGQHSTLGAGWIYPALF